MQNNPSMINQPSESNIQLRHNNMNYDESRNVDARLKTGRKNQVEPKGMFY